jgi:hypothetical protein
VSSSDAILIATTLPVAEAAEALAAMVGGEVSREGSETFVVVRPPGDVVREVGGDLHPNIYGAPPDPEPDELSVLDGYALAWDIVVAPRGDDDVLHAASRQLFDRLVAAGTPWPLLLTRDVTSALVAGALPGEAVTDFPPGTLPDWVHRERWGRFDLARR